MGIGSSKRQMTPFLLYSLGMRRRYKQAGIEFPSGMPQIILLTQTQWNVGFLASN